MTPADLARSLTEAQKRALLWLPVRDWSAGRGWSAGPAYWQVSNTIKALSNCEHPLTKSRVHPERSQTSGPVLQWRLTPLGKAVRAELAKERP